MKKEEATSMPIAVRVLTSEQLATLLEIEESHFIDLKATAFAPGSLTKAASAFCNTSGGELFVGIEEIEGPKGKERLWQGFEDQEAANAHLQVIEKLSPLGNHYDAEFLSHENVKGLVLHINVHKTQDIVAASTGKVYVRRVLNSIEI